MAGQKSVPAEPDLLRIEAFGHEFVELDGNAEHLITLEKEGAIYSHFWDESTGTFRYYRVQFLPNEIFQFVEAHVAKQQFDAAIAAGATFDEALEAIKDPNVEERVRSYCDYGHAKLPDGSEVDLRGCAASFYPPEMEALVCGLRGDRYELLPNLTQTDRLGLLVRMVDSFPVVAAHLSDRRASKSGYEISDEYDVQDLLFACVRSAFEDARQEEWTPKHAGTAKRIDIVVPSAETVLEVKRIRDKAHARNVGDELKVDIESYHAHSHCNNLLVLVFDPGGFIKDPAQIGGDLSGHRVKGSSSFDVTVMVRR